MPYSLIKSEIVLAVLGVLSILMLPARGLANAKHLNTAMRMIGHELLLSSGDSTSRVLPIEEQGNSFLIGFDTEFGFQPEKLVNLIDSVNGHAHFARHYLVEVLTCESGQVVYSYEVGDTARDIIPCRGRQQEIACYNLRLTILDPMGPFITPVEKSPKEASVKPRGFIPLVVLIALILTVSLLWVYFRQRNSAQVTNPHLMVLGAYRFDPAAMELVLKGEHQELTGKESELLLLLYKSVNTTVEREVILNKVWGDEGDYVGRTLDVFISKLRKKLEGDPHLKIINVRGVGYKLVMNGE